MILRSRAPTGATIDVPDVIIGEVVAREDPVCTGRLVEDWNVRFDAVLIDEPGKHLGRAIAAVDSDRDQTLNRQSERYAREGIDLSLSTLADQVGACAGALQSLYGLIVRHALAAERPNGDDTTVPIGRLRWKDLTICV